MAWPDVSTSKGRNETDGTISVEVSVIIPCRNEEDCIEQCVRSILSQQFASGDIEILVADGFSTDGTRDILRRLAAEDSRVRLIDNPRRFVSNGLNAAIAAACGRIIIRIDAHTTYASDYIQQCVSILKETGAENVGGPALTYAEGYVQNAIAAAYHSPFAVGGARFHDPHAEGYVDTVPYGCWPRSVFSRIGLFDEQLVRNQDDEFNLRLVRSGGKIWQSPRIKSWYRTRNSLPDLFSQYRQYGYWKVHVIKKHRLPASVRHLVPGCYVSLVLMLFMISFWVPSVWLVLGVLVGGYVGCNLIASVITARKRAWGLLFILPAVFATYHVAYGVGFLSGVVDVFVLRRRLRPSCLHLSRSSIRH